MWLRPNGWPSLSGATRPASPNDSAGGSYTYTFAFGPPLAITASIPNVDVQLNASPFRVTAIVPTPGTTYVPAVGGSTLKPNTYPSSAQLGLPGTTTGET